MIIDLKKILLIGTKKETDDFFTLAQEKGFLEFISHKKRREDFPLSLQSLVQALKVLKKYPKEKKEETETGEEPQVIAKRILALEQEIAKLEEDSRILRIEIARVAPFGEFSIKEIKDIEDLTGRKIQFFCMKEQPSHRTNFPDDILYINTEYDLDYFIGFSKDKILLPNMIEMHIEQPASRLKERLNENEIKKILHLEELHILKKYEPLIHRAFLHELNTYHLKAAIHLAESSVEDTLFVIEAWIPVSHLKELEKLIQEKEIYYEEIPADPHEIVPTYMLNEGFAKVGEDLVKIYDVPASTDKDPSTWVLCAFSIFFAIIIGDAGYGLLYLLFALYLKKKHPRLKGFAKRFVKLALLLSTTTLIWGVLNSSYFGILLPYDKPLKRYSLIGYLAEKKADYHLKKQDEVFKSWEATYPHLKHVNSGQEFLEQAFKTTDSKKQFEAYDEFSDNILLELSLLIGVVHICLSFCRYLFRNWAGLGWIAFIIGGYLYFPLILNASSVIYALGWIDREVGIHIGKQLFWGGFSTAVILAILQRKWSGCMEFMTSISVFADVLSYLRLYALALAGAIMAATFNDFGIKLGFVIGAIVVVAGHFINLLLGIMGGTIHGLRLNFIEWYHYSFKGGGRLFNPLRRL